MYNFLAKIIFLVIVSIIYFVVKETISSIDITSYIFIVFSYLLFISISYFPQEFINRTLKKLPLYQISFIYLIIEIIIAIYVSYLGIENINNYVLVQCIITGLFLIIFFIILDINSHTDEQNKEQITNITFLKILKNSFNNMLLITKNDNEKEKIQFIIDVIQSTPVKSYQEEYSLKKEIIKKVEDIENKLKQDVSIYDDLIHIIELLTKRN